MFKRLFFLSGIIAFVLAFLTMWFWYLPNHPDEKTEVNQTEVDTVTVQDTVKVY